MSVQHYQGGCQCGAVRYEVDVDLDHVVVCNCSRCRRIGSMFSFTPASAFTLLRGQDALTDYQFNHNVIHHLFCGTCGVESFARAIGPDGADTVAINARCLDDIEPDDLTPVKFDGRSQ